MSKFFQRRPKLHEPVEKIYKCIFRIARKKSCDYLLIIYMKNLRWLSRRNARISRNQEKIGHPGCALDLKKKYLIGYL